jgi:hypothetical protein
MLRNALDADDLLDDDDDDDEDDDNDDVDDDDEDGNLPENNSCYSQDNSIAGDGRLVMT